MLNKYFKSCDIIIDDIEPSVIVTIDTEFAEHLQVGDELVIKDEDLGVSEWIKKITNTHKKYENISIVLTKRYIFRSFDFFATTVDFKEKD